jgi:selenocysteine-specific elongation factor
MAPPRRRNRAGAAARLSHLAKAPARERIAILASESPHGASIEELVSRTGLRTEAIREYASQTPLILLPQPHEWVLDRAWIEQRVSAIEKRLATFHRDNPLAAGLQKEEVRSRELSGAPAFLFEALLSRAKSLVLEGDLLRLASHRVRLDADEDEAVSRIERAFEGAGLAVPSIDEVLGRCGIGESRGRTLLQLLLRRGTLVRISPDLVFHRTALESLRATLAAHKGERFIVPAFKEWTGISRKYAIPLLEYLDRERVTRREGDARLVL